MKQHFRRNLVNKVWHTARVEGWRSVLDIIVPDCLPSVRSHLLFGFDSMQDVLRWIFKHKHYDVYSFDIFDTLLRRRIDPPESIKCLVSEHISESSQ